MKPLQLLTWNCLSCFPQYYDTVKTIEHGASDKPLHINRRYNIQRYHNIVGRLLPHFQQLKEKTLFAITLQEVDFELLEMLKDCTHIRFPELYVHHRSPYMIYPQDTPPPHEYSYFLVTIHHRHNRQYEKHTSPPQKMNRCLITRLKQMTLYNVHIPWVGSDHTDYRKKRTEQTIRSLASALHKQPNSIIIGDLNLSCTFNDILYKQCFAQRVYTINIFGESYKLSPENVLQRKTFTSLEHTPDDGCIAHNKHHITSHFNSLTKEKLPVDTNGWFLKSQKDKYPSDHAMVWVACTTISTNSKSNRQNTGHYKKNRNTLSSRQKRKTTVRHTFNHT